jgi:hypothetical protein
MNRLINQLSRNFIPSLLTSIYFVLVIITLLLPKRTLGQACRQYKAYLENNCIVPIDRYLSRSLEMSQIVGVATNFNTPGCASVFPGLGCDVNYDNECQGFNGYCPTRYWEDINLCVELKASFIIDAATNWGSEDLIFSEGSSYWVAAGQAVKDINTAYACALLREPIIGASLFEYVSSEVEKISITKNIITSFQDEFNAADALYYLDVYGNPKLNLKFKLNRIVYSHCLGEACTHYDLSKIEARMFKYYCAKKYIDDGYKALHLGIQYVQTYNDQPTGYTNTYNLCNKIRAYAASIGSFVLLDFDQSETLYYNNTPQIINDFNLSPIRPDELSASCSYLETHLTSYNSAAPIQSVINHYTGGTAPSGCFFSDRGPYILWWDNNGGYPTGADPVSDHDPTHHNAGYDVWGYDEVKWFQEVSDLYSSCAPGYLKDLVCTIRSLENSHRGYIPIPGRRKIDPWGDGVGWWRLYDHSNIKDEIKNNIWAPNDNDAVTVHYTCYEIIGECTETLSQTERHYIFSAPFPDCSTVYSWHILYPDKVTWEPVRYGSSITFTPPSDGKYQITLRRDNFAFTGPSAPNGTKSKTYSYNLESTCCVHYSGGQKTTESNKDSVIKDYFQNVLLIYPNPTDGKFTLDLTITNSLLNGFAKLDILTPFGNKIHTESFIIEQQRLIKEFDSSDFLENGVYIANIKINGISLQKKFVVAR